MASEFFQLQRFGDGDDGGAAQGDGASQTGGDAQEGQDELQELRTKIDALSNENQELKRRLEQATSLLMSPQYMQQLRQGAQPEGAQVATPSVSEEPEEPEEEPDYEHMTPKQFAAAVAKQVRQQLLKELHPKIESVASKAEMAQAQQEVAEASARYPDFWMYRDAMIQVAREYEARGVGLRAEDAYHIAKGRVAAAKSSMTGTATSGARQTTQRKPQPPATERAGVSPGATSKGELKGRDAIEEAWRRAGLDKLLGEG